MSRTTGTKRKLANIAESSVNVPSLDSDAFLQSVDAEIDTAIAKIKDGSHVELGKRAEALNRAKENKIAAADRHRKMQIKNITALYEYEIEDANSLYNKAYGEVQEEMIQDLIAEKSRLKAAHKQAVQQANKNSKLAEKEASKDDNYLSNANQMINKSLANIPMLNLSQNGATNGTGTRSLRSTAADRDSTSVGGDYVSADSKLEQLFNRNGNSSSNNNSTTNGLSTSSSAAQLLGAVRSGGSRRKTTTNINGSTTLDQVLSESSMRSDFLEIVRDLQARAEAFEHTKPKALTKEVSLNADYSELTIGSDVYGVGEYVNVFSVLSQETLSGMITAISHCEIIVKIGTGSRFSFTLANLKAGRVVLSRDTETNEHNDILRAAMKNGRLPQQLQPMKYKMVHHSHTVHHKERPITAEDEGDNYDEEEFEEASYDSEDKDGPSTKPSPAKPRTPKPKTPTKKSVAGLDLETYMDMNDTNKSDGPSPKTRDMEKLRISNDMNALEGIYPKTGDKEQILRRNKMGYDESTLTPKNPNLVGSQSNQELRSSKVIVPEGTPVKHGLAFEDAKLSVISPKPVAAHSAVDDQINAIYRKLEIVQDNADAVKSSKNSSSNKNSKDSPGKVAANESNSLRVDALLMELFPEKMEKINGKKKSNKQQYGLGAVRSQDIAHYINVANHNQQPSKYAGDEQNTTTALYAEENTPSSPRGGVSIEQQLKQLRKELKVKEDKLTRVTEHSMMMAAHMDKIKGENALLTQKLREAQMELEAKESRLVEALKQKKKTTKKVTQSSTSDIASLQNENYMLKEREQALMDAVEELSVQNQDLIMKLKQSMQRELELSSKRAALVSNNVANMTDNNHLPHIARMLNNASEGRAQSEPSDGVNQKKSTKKRK